MISATIFTPELRAHLRATLLDRAANDRRLSGVAITGSAAADAEDRWSDIDLAFGVADAAEMPNVLADWTECLYRQHSALQHLDVHAGAWIYRVFLLPGTLQVDLAFVPAAEFRALAPTFRLVSGTANEPRHAPSPSPADLIGYAWLYALHARACIARGQLWQAEYMVSGVRDHALALACVGNDLPAVHGRGFDRLPDAVKSKFAGAFVRHLESAELTRAFRVAVEGLLTEIRSTDEELAGRLQETLRSLM